MPSSSSVRNSADDRPPQGAPQAAPLLPDDVPTGWREAAEEIRDHLVLVRGGAPFLSPADARVLMAWLEEEVPVSSVLRAIERAAEARRKKRSRLPLTLGLAKRHLGRPTRGALPKGVEEGEAHPFRPLHDALIADAREPDVRALAETLLAIEPEDPEHLVREGLAAIRAFLDQRWRGLGRAERDALLAAASEELADLTALLGDAALREAVEEAARDRLRATWPLLTAATLWDLVET